VKQAASNSFSFIEPMLALRVPELPAGGWLYEVKFDGYRALAFKTGSEVQLLSRNRKLFNDNYPVLIDALKSLKVNFVIDGEITALDANGLISEFSESFKLHSDSGWSTRKESLS
jgi:bifunctional non-homologous end joining protein LigD